MKKSRGAHVSWQLLGLFSHGLRSIWLMPLVLTFAIQAYIYSQQIEVYSKGIYLFGDFIEWSIINKMHMEDDHTINIMVSGRETFHYSIDHLEESHAFYKRLSPFVNIGKETLTDEE